MATVATDATGERSLLAADEPAPYTVLNSAGSSELVLVCDHAANRVPRRLRNLGLTAETLRTHIAWDPGAALVAQALAHRLDAPLVLSQYSRLVIDCNRPLASVQSVPDESAGTRIPGNCAMTPEDRTSRIEEIFNPYHNAVNALLQRRGGATTLLSIHSFTPVLNNAARPWEIGVAFYRDSRLAQSLFLALHSPGDVLVGYNQPYAIETEHDFTVPVHGEARGLPSAMIEIRQDGIRSQAAAERWVVRLAAAWREVSDKRR